MPDGKRILTTSWKGTNLWEVATGERLRAFHEGHADHFSALSPDGRILMTEGDRNAVLWDVATGRELVRLLGVAGSGRSK